MSIKKNILTGYVLAGGKSSRMGADKGLLLFNGKPIIQQVIEQLQPVVNKTVIISNNPAFKKFELEVVGDLIKDIGPAGGIHTALSHSHSRHIFIVSCDMPFISTDAIRFIILNSAQSQITLPVYQGKTEPLFGVYLKECLPKWCELIDRGVIKLHNMITCFDLLKLNVDENALFNELLFTNINTKTDLEMANKRKLLK